MENKHWKGDTLNSSGSKVVQIRNDKEMFAIKSNDTEVVLDRQEAQFLLISLQNALKKDNNFKSINTCQIIKAVCG